MLMQMRESLLFTSTVKVAVRAESRKKEQKSGSLRSGRRARGKKIKTADRNDDGFTLDDPFVLEISISSFDVCSGASWASRGL